MEIKLFNPQEYSKYSIFGKTAGHIFLNSSIGLDLAFTIYKIKAKIEEDSDSRHFEDFLKVFFDHHKDSGLPHHLPLGLTIYNGDYEINKLPPDNNYYRYIKSITELLINNQNSLITLLGDSGSGKTTTMLATAFQTIKSPASNEKKKKKKEEKPLLYGYVPVYLNINKFNHNKPAKIIFESAGLKITDYSKKSIIKYLTYAPGLLFFLDVNAGAGEINIFDDKKKLVKKRSIKKAGNVDKLEEVIENIRDLLDSVENKHKLIIAYRGSRELAKLDNEDFYHKIKTLGLTWEVSHLEKERAREYVKEVSTSEGEKILGKISSENENIITTPIFLDFINWLAIQQSSLGIENIRSGSELYLIFTREILRTQFKSGNIPELSKLVIEKEQEHLLSHKEDDFSREYAGGEMYFLENKPHPVELFLMIIARELGDSFTSTQLDNLLKEIFDLKQIEKIRKKSKRVKDFKFLVKKMEANVWLTETRLKDKFFPLINKLSEELLKNTFFVSNGNEFQFFHPSICDYYRGKSIFYDLSKSGIVFDNMKHYETNLNNFFSKKVLLNFAELFEITIFTKRFTNIFELLDKLSLKPSFYFYLGIVYDDKGILDDSIISYKKAINLKIDFAEAHFNLGISYELKGILDKAIDSYKKAIKIKHDFTEAHGSLGNAYSDQGKLTKAINSYKKAIKIDPNNGITHLNIGITYHNLKEYEKAIESFNKTIELEPNDTEAYNNLGNAYYFRKMFDEAIESYKKAIKIKHDFTESHYNLGVVYELKGRFDEAIESYKKAINLNPNLVEAHCNLGLTYYSKKMFNKSINSFNKAINLNPNLAAAHCNLGIAYNAKGMLDTAIIQYKKAIKIDPNDVIAYYNLACTYSLMKFKTESMENLKKAIDLDEKYKQMAREDSDFEWLWNNQDFNNLTK